MAKVRTLSKVFMTGHPKCGKPTFFVEKFLKSIGVDYSDDRYLQALCGLNTKNLASGKLSFEDIESFWISLQKTDDEKHHTVRSGIHFKEGDMISIRCWFGKPYKDCQIILAPDLEIKKTFLFSCLSMTDKMKLPNGTGIFIDNKHVSPDFMIDVAKNDGLELADFLLWFNYPSKFYGQVICWNQNIKY